MNFSFPSLNINIISELNDLFDEIIKIKKTINDYEQKIDKACQIQNRKIQVIHNLFNDFKKSKSETVINSLLESEQFIRFNEKIDDMHKTYQEYREMRMTSNNILEKSYNKLQFMNNDISETCKNIEKDHKVLNYKIEVLEKKLDDSNKLIIQNTNTNKKIDLLEKELSNYKFQLDQINSNLMHINDQYSLNKHLSEVHLLESSLGPESACLNLDNNELEKISLKVAPINKEGDNKSWTKVTRKKYKSKNRNY